MATPLRVLVLQTEPSDVELMMQELRQAEFDPAWESVESEQGLLEGFEEPPDVILAEHAPPRLDALHVLRLLQERGLDIPLIVISGPVGEEAAVECMRQGADDYLLKDRLSRLGQAVKRALADKRLSDEKQQAEAALRESEERYRAISELTSDFAFAHRVDFDGAFVPEWVAGAFSRITNFTAEEVVARGGWESLIHPDDWPSAERRRRALLDGHSDASELRIVTKRGSTRLLRVHSRSAWDDPQGRVVRVYGAAQDITERAQTEEALRDSEGRFRRLADNAQDMIFRYEMKPRKGFTYMSPAVLPLVGFTPEQNYADPRLAFTVVHPEDLSALQAIAAGQATPEPVNIRWRHKDGHTVWTELRNVPIYDSEGTLVAIEGIARDITERRRAEQALHETNRRLEQALADLKSTQQQMLQQERLRALGQMASGIAHDFNNSLSPILGFSELLLTRPEGLDDKQKLTRYLQLIHTGANDAAQVVSRLLRCFRDREDSEVRQPVHLNLLVEQVVSLTQPKWRDQALANGVTITIDTELQDVPQVSGNESDFREVLTNLIFNAVDAIRESGAITLRTRIENQQVILEVSDTGMGMTEEARQRCREPFFSSKGERGTGLGLAMVDAVISRHGGEISIASEVGKGTTFTIRLPMQVAHKASGKRPSVQGRPRLLRVLHVEDDPLVREVVVEYLTGDGHTVETAGNGREGLDLFRSDSFDLVITDRAMAEMSGEQLAIAIKEISPSTPVILLTGFGEALGAEGECPDGVVLVLSKPLKLTALRQALAKVTGAS